jgi:TetR/AcrR family transcriptional regulator, transcriptional repressor for nem operon
MVKNCYGVPVMARPREFDAEMALSQTMRVFWEQGYRASTFADLVKAADVQKQSLYCAFGDKRSLFLKSLELYRNQVLSQIRDQLSEADSPLEGIAGVMRYASQPPGPKARPSGCLMANTALELGVNDPDVAAEVKRLFRGMERLLTGAVKKGQERGEITTRFDSAAIGQSLANTINGFRILENTGASRQQLRTVADMALAVIKT